MRRKWGLIRYCAASHRSVCPRDGLVRLIPMIGNAENVSRYELISTVEGSDERTSASRLITYSSDCVMSTRQSKNTLMSADPRPVVERMLTVPGTAFIASSMGRVMVAIISSAGITPLSMRITTRGKFVCGKTEDGIVTAANTPARHRTSTMNRIAVDWRVAKLPTKEVRVIGVADV